MVARGGIARGARVRATLGEMGQSLAIVSEPNAEIHPAAKPSILIIDDTTICFFSGSRAETGWLANTDR
jgi:hypothetical protein